MHKTSNNERNKKLAPTRLNVGRTNLLDWETRKQGGILNFAGVQLKLTKIWAKVTLKLDD